MLITMLIRRLRTLGGPHARAIDMWMGTPAAPVSGSQRGLGEAGTNWSIRARSGGIGMDTIISMGGGQGACRMSTRDIRPFLNVL